MRSKNNLQNPLYFTEEPGHDWFESLLFFPGWRHFNTIYILHYFGMGFIPLGKILAGYSISAKMRILLWMVWVRAEHAARLLLTDGEKLVSKKFKMFVPFLFGVRDLAGEIEFALFFPVHVFLNVFWAKFIAIRCFAHFRMSEFVTVCLVDNTVAKSPVETLFLFVVLLFHF